jgi:nucleotide-binding universal stress UspA family protein
MKEPLSMFSRIVAGVDGSEGGADALALARRLARPDAEIIAVSVSPTILGPPRVAGDDDVAAAEEARVRLDASCEKDDALGREVMIARSVADGLAASAERHDADLVVIGSSRRGPIGRILDGDDTRATIRGAICPVAVAPRGFAQRDTGISLLGVGWDGTPEANRAVEIAREIGRASGVPVEVLTVSGSTAWDQPEPVAVTSTLDTSEDAPAPALPDGYTPTTATGPAATALASFIEKVDLLVVGTHKRGMAGRFAHGSTAETLARRAPRPVLVVP